MTPTLYTTTTHKQRRKIFYLLREHTSIEWANGDRPSPNDLASITRDMLLTFDGKAIAVRLGIPQGLREQSTARDILRAIRHTYPIVAGKGNRGNKGTNKAHPANNAVNNRQSTQKVLF
jgi:hypothetical protein